MLVPAIIQPHLVPFLVDELKHAPLLDGMDKSLTHVHIENSSNAGSFIAAQIPDLPKNYRISLYFKKGSGMPRFYEYGYLSLKYKEALMMPEKRVHAINLFLENLMRTAMVFYVMGRVKKSDDPTEVHKSIECFMEKYNLYDYDIDMEQYRQLYYRSKRLGNTMFRFHLSGPGIYKKTF